MNKVVMICLLAVVLGAALTPAVSAQGTVKVQKPISIKLGVYLPVKTTLSNVIGSTWFAAGADYAFYKTDSATPTIPLAYVDYTGSSKDGLRASLIGVGVGVRDYLHRATNTKVAPYYGAGIGLYFAHTDGLGSSLSKTQLGGKLFVGAEVNSGPFVEAAYQIVSQDIGGSSLGGFNIYLGDRF